MPSSSRLLFVAAGLLLAGCPDPAAQFINGHLLEPCNGAWPVCTEIAGCSIDQEYYLQGQFPGTRRFMIRTTGQAQIAVDIFLLTEGAIGLATRIDWWEAGCGSKSSAVTAGQDFFKESEVEGQFRRVESVYQPGDHLIEVDSDATAEYYLKVEIIKPSE